MTAQLVVECHIKPSRLYALYFRYVLLSILTLGIYRFWARTEIRQYLWSAINIDGEPFEYTGKGSELFFGFIKAMLLLSVLAIAFGAVALLVSVLLPKSVVVAVLSYGAYGVGLVFLTSLVRYSVGRYRLSRTRLRGIGFSLSGSILQYAILSFKMTLLDIVTLGLVKPYTTWKKIDYEVSRISFGTKQIMLLPASASFKITYYVCYFLVPVTFGLSLFWYQAATWCEVVKNVRLDDVRADLHISGMELLLVTGISWILVVISLGVLYPYLVALKTKLVCDKLHIQGNIRYDEIAQTIQNTSSSGEGMSDILDVGIGY